MNRWLATLLFLLFGSALNAQSDTIYVFEFDLKFIGASQRFEEADRYKLEYLIDLMKEDSTMRVEIRGHVCCGPSEKISTNRAKKVYQEMISYGITESRLTYKGYNNTKPAAFPEKTDEDAARNRRVDFVIRRKK